MEVDKLRRIDESSYYYSVCINISHFELAEELSTNYGEKKYVYSYLEID
jgi:hypothetical protein